MFVRPYKNNSLKCSILKGLYVAHNTMHCINQTDLTVQIQTGSISTYQISCHITYLEDERVYESLDFKNQKPCQCSGCAKLKVAVSKLFHHNG